MTKDSAPTKIIHLRNRLGKSSSYIARYKERLVTSGIIESTQYGIVQFVLPYMKEYLIGKQRELELLEENE